MLKLYFSMQDQGMVVFRQQIKYQALVF